MQRPKDQGDGEIIVTAQKREQRLNDVGITIVAAGAEQLKSTGVADIRSAEGFVGPQHRQDIFRFSGILTARREFQLGPDRRARRRQRLRR